MVTAKEIEGLLAELNTSRDKVAEGVIRKLKNIGGAAVPALLAAVRDRSSARVSPNIRKWSLEALGEIGDPRAAKDLVRALRDERMTVRLHALRGIGRLAYKPASRAVKKLLTDPSGGIRVNAIDVLVILKAKSAGKNLIKMLNDEHWYVRQHAVRALGELSVTSALPRLRRLRKTEKRRAVLTAIDKISFFRN